MVGRLLLAYPEEYAYARLEGLSPGQGQKDHIQVHTETASNLGDVLGQGQF